MNEEQLKILLEAASKLAELNTLVTIQVILNQLLKREIKVSEDSVRKLDAREILEIFSASLDSYIIRSKEKWTL